MFSLGQIKKKVKKLIVRSKSKDSYPAELLKTREGRHIEGINTDNGIPEELYPAFVRLVRALGMGDDLYKAQSVVNVKTESISNNKSLITMKDNNRKKFPWPEFWAVVCGAICLLQGTFFCMMIVHYYQWLHGVVLWYFVEPYWYTIPQLLLCLTGMVLTVRRFIRKREGLAIKKIEWIPLIVSYAFSLIYLFLN